MGNNWKRQIQVIAGDRIISLDDFDIFFQYTFDTSEEPNECEVEINNLAQTTINSSIVKNKRLIVNAGYEGDVGNLFKGNIFDTTTGWAGTEKSTNIIAFDATDEYLNRTISKTYTSGATATQILHDVVAMTGLSLGEVRLKNNTQYHGGRTVNGKLRDVLRSVIVDDCQTNLQIANGVILIRPVGVGNETGFILSPDTGLIGSPEPITQTDNDKDADQKGDYIIRCLLNYRVSVNSRIYINSSTVKSEAVVLRGTHSGSRTGAFETKAEVKLI